MIRIMIADDQPIIRHGLKYVLGLDPELELAGEAADGNDLLEQMKQTACDVVLMDIRMPDMDGVEATRQVKKLFPETKVLILTTFEDNEYIFRALEYGADGYLLKDADPDELIQAVKTIERGGMLLHPRIAETVRSALRSDRPVPEQQAEQRPDKFMELTEREYEIACMVRQGYTNREIAEKVFVSEGTVKNHVTRILDKLELENRKQLIVYMR